MSQDNIPEIFIKRINVAKEQQSEELDLSSNWYVFDDSEKLTKIPDAVFKLTHLKILDLRNNQLTNLPESISQLSNLTRLYLINNQLINLPNWLAENKLEIKIEDQFASKKNLKFLSTAKTKSISKMGFFSN